MKQTQKLWRAHFRAEFPQNMMGGMIGASDAALLDASIAGCVSVCMGNNGRLDQTRISVLQGCYQELCASLHTIDDYAARDYFERLKQMAKIVLDEVGSR